MSINETEVAWMAGFFDGEGSLSIQVILPNQTRKHPMFAPRACIKIKYGVQVLDRFQEAFGGKIFDDSRGARTWNLFGKNDLAISVGQLLPHLKVKQAIAAKFLDALDLIPDLRGINRFGGQRAWTDEATYRMMDIAISLNPPDARNAKQKAQVEKVKAYMALLQVAA